MPALWQVAVFCEIVKSGRGAKLEEVGPRVCAFDVGAWSYPVCFLFMR